MRYCDEFRVCLGAIGSMIVSLDLLSMPVNIQGVLCVIYWSFKLNMN